MSREATIIIPTRSISLLKKSIASIRRHTRAQGFRILVIHHVGGKDDAKIDTFLKQSNLGFVRHYGVFNFAAMNNAAVRCTSSAYLVFLNDDVRPCAEDWLDLLLARISQSEIAIAGARLLYPDGTIQHVGIVVGMSDGAGHPGRHMLHSPWWPWDQETRDVSAVTGACMAVRRDVFNEVGGFDDCFPVNYNDVDLCLRVREVGYRVVLENDSVLVHHESSTRRSGTALLERLRFRRKWRDYLERDDPYFSPHLLREREQLVLDVSGLNKPNA